jgi:uncharacterized membrane protein|tara:strand:+ start:1314 stop:1724 length:411 start_codon:yes stop_codon:yes gene_type:complete
MKSRLLLIFLALLLIFVLLFNVFLYFKISSILEIRKIDASVSVSENIGFDLNNSMLSFGKVLPGGSSSRVISISNDFDRAINIKIYGAKDMKDFVQPFNEILDVGEVKMVNIAVIIPKMTDLGDYSGEVIVEVLKA